MRVLVTGAAGFIGSHVCEQLAQRGDEVVGLDNLDETLYPAAVKERTLESLGRLERFRFVRGDIVEPGLVAEWVRGDIDVVVHLAALAGVRPSLAQPKRYERVNCEGTVNLLEACRAAGVRRFVFASSSSVYGVHTPLPFREDAIADRPSSPYAATKRAGELWVATYAHLYELGAISLRFFTVYGPRGRPEMAIASFARAIEAKKPIPIFGDGESSRDYTYVEDTVKGVLGAVDRCQPGSGHEIYNLGNSRPVKLHRLVELLEQTIGKRALLDRLPAQPGDVPHTSADCSRAQSALGYSPSIPLEEGLRRTVEWMRANPLLLP